MNWLLIFVPISIGLEFSAPERYLLVFVTSALAILPLAAWMGRATEQLAERMATAHEFGLSNVFVGVFVVAILGNAAEHATAIGAAVKDRMDLSLSIAVGSSVQVALFVAPVLVFASLFLGPETMDLAFPAGLCADGSSIRDYHRSGCRRRTVRLAKGLATPCRLPDLRPHVLLFARRIVPSERKETGFLVERVGFEPTVRIDRTTAFEFYDSHAVLCCRVTAVVWQFCSDDPGFV